MNRDLFLAILAMDSYNRGYGQSIKLAKGDATSGIDERGRQVGNATIILQSDVDNNEPGVAAGFYAIAYDVSRAGVDGLDGTVVSYRGSDNFTGSADVASRVH